LRYSSFVLPKRRKLPASCALPSRRSATPEPERCEHDFRIDRGTKDGFPPFKVAVCNKRLGVWPDGELQMPWKLREPVWTWSDGGVLTEYPQQRIGATVPPEQRAKIAPKRERYEAVRRLGEPGPLSP
jgi:hypothetical protein